MGFGGSGGGSASIAGSSDVALNNPANNNVLTYDTSSSKWKNAASAAVVPQDWGILPTLYWSGTAWPTRTVPSGYSGPIIWDSAADDSATVPSGSIAGDRWLRRVS